MTRNAALTEDAFSRLERLAAVTTAEQARQDEQRRRWATSRKERPDPTPERMAKGDIAPHIPRDDPKNKDARDLEAQFSAPARRRDDPLVHMRARGLLTADEYAAGLALASRYEKACREQGARLLTGSSHGTPRSGLTQSKIEALSEFHAMCDALGDKGTMDRLNRERVLIAVCCEGKSIREYLKGRARFGGHARAQAQDFLVSGLQRLVRAREMV